MLLLANSIQKMTKKDSKVQQILAGNVKMDTCTSFYANGDVNIMPCPWECEKQVTDGGRRQPKGRMTIEEDGTSHFRAYAKDSGSRYNTLFRTAHGEVKETRDSVICQLRFPKKLGKALIESLYSEETEEQGAFIKTRRTEIQW
jgi:hypothetical protein